MGMGSFSTSLLILLLAVSHFHSPSTVAAQDERKLHIIYMGSRMPSTLPPKFYYDKLMRLVIGSDEYNKNPSKYLKHFYHRSFHGCAAKLTDAEAQKIAGMEGVISVFPNKKMELHTTRSWDFIGFPMNVPRSAIEKDVIVGVLDTGIWPESMSFSDTGLSPVPAKWKGICQQAANFSCNRKIIGARFYRASGSYPESEEPTPRDFDGHGSHTASIVAGGMVSNASFYGFASGIARGGVPGARIAVYKVCWKGGACDTADILHAFDDAIADGVDIISVSIGTNSSEPYVEDTKAIGSFHAMQRGILSSFSAGNDGPTLGRITNVAPWLLSVAASTIDRDFSTNVQLGNGASFPGKLSLNPFDPSGKQFPMIYGMDAPNSSFPSEARFCTSLNQTLIEGKIVFCELGNNLTEAGGETFNAGAAGIILQYGGFDDTPVAYPLPLTIVGLDSSDGILSYITNTSDPMGAILKTNTIEDDSAPYTTFFSSRGPNEVTPGILKPDLSAPGLNILAAYSPIGEVSPVVGDTRSVQYKILSGTSMACPHASGAAAYLKSYHSDWSPAAIRSALMTTALPMSPTINTEAELAYGAGQINPTQALDPGLVYDADEADYVNFLCGQGLTMDEISTISSNFSSCPQGISSFAGDLNYPSISVATNSSTFNQTFPRRVKNVANETYSSSLYTVNVTAPQGLSVVVTPNTLQFTESGQELYFTVQVEGTLDSPGEVASASIEWSDGVHNVRSPIVAFRSP